MTAAGNPAPDRCDQVLNSGLARCTGSNVLDEAVPACWNENPSGLRERTSRVGDGAKAECAND